MFSIRFVYHLSLLVSLSIVSNFIDKYWGRNLRLSQFLQGVLFGGVAAVGMLEPLNLGPGLIFDGRSIMVSLCAYFFGPWPAAVATTMAIACCISLGGVGVVAGGTVVLVSAGIGLLAYFRSNPHVVIPSTLKLYIFGLVVHLAMLATMLMLPEQIGFSVLKRIGLPVLLFYPLATILVGKILSDQIQARQSLIEIEASKKRLTEAQYIAKLGDFTWDVETGKVTWSDALFDLLKYDKSEEIDYARVNQEIHHPDDIERVTQWLNDCISSGDRVLTPNEYRLIRKDGEVMHVRTTGVIKQDEGKSPTIFATVQDITERKQAEEEIRSAESFIDRVVDMSPFAMWISDRKGTVIRTNSSLRKTLNMPDDKIVGQYNVLKDENLEIQGVMPMVMAVFEKHEPASFSISWKAAKAGNVNFESEQDLYIDVSMFPIVSAAGELTNAVCQWVDITEHKKTEESLRESHAKFKSIVDNIGIGVALISPDMEILEMNHQLRQWFPDCDLDNSPICYRTFNNPPREEICEYCPTIKTLKDGQVYEDTTATPQSGSIRNYRIVSSPLTNSQGEVIAVIEMVEDITERLNLQAQLTQAQKMESVGRLAGGVAHDYNNISSIIIGFSELALEKVEQNDPVHDDLMEIYTAANRSTDITRQLLAFARQQNIAPKVLDLNDTIESMLKMLRRLVGEDIDLAWLPGSEVWPIKLDPSQVDQIMANLCVNARDAIEDVGKVTIETKNISFDETYCADHAGFVPGEYVMLVVSDDGSGIAPEALDKIFEPFFTTKGFDQGTGLGLSTVYGIAKQNNGFINVYSELKKGTTIKIYLPRHSSQAVEAHSEKTLEIPLSKGETLLLVEDNDSILKLGEKILKNLGYLVLSANSPSEAIKLTEEHAGEINLLITDVVMPEMNGRELSEQLRMISPDLKTLFMSGYTANVIAHRGVLEDGVCFMSKPFSKKDMAFKVRGVLDGAN